MRFYILAGFFVLWGMSPAVHEVAAAESSGKNLRPDEVLVIANDASEDSMTVARYYMMRRGIPKENLFTVSFPNQKHHRYIAHRDFQEKLVYPLQRYLEKKELKEKVLALVTVYDVPYKVKGPVALPPTLQKKINQKEAALLKRQDQSGEEHHKTRRLRHELETLKSQYKRLAPVWREVVALLPAGQRKLALRVLDNSSAVDSELAWLFRSDVYGPSVGEAGRMRSYFGRSRNLYFAQGLKFRAFRAKLKERKKLKNAGLLYLTARLEGPTVEISKGLVDLAIQAEEDGPVGIGCFDAKKSTIGRAKTGYELGDAWVRRAYIEAFNAGFKVKLDEQKTLWQAGDCPHTFLYWGWYALANFQDIFGGRLAPGALAVHTASGEAKDIRRYKKQGKNPWCSGLLTQGAAFCSGPISEPFLDAFPHADLFYPRLFNGWSAGEAYWASQAYTSWMMVMIGDPLYAPFSGKNRLKTHVSGRILFAQKRNPAPVRILGRDEQYEVTLLLKAIGPIFKKVNQYKITEYKTNRPEELTLTGLDQVSFQVSDGGALLVVRGMKLETGALEGLNQGELEVQFDLGTDGGRKIISERFGISELKKRK